MKQYKYLYSKMLERSTIDKAYKKLRKGKTKRSEIKKIDANYEFYAEKMKCMLIGFTYDETVFTPCKHEPILIEEHGKTRTIYVPDIWEQWVHHIIIQVLSPIILNTSWAYSCGSMPKRGAHMAKRKIEKWLLDYKSAKYFLKFDIRHFYNSVDHDVLWKFMSIYIKDSLFLRLCKRCLMHFKKGIPLGFYISQWFANFILMPLDRLITNTYGLTKTVRYMDDVVIFSGNKKLLKRLLSDVKQTLGSLHLKLKDNWQICRMEYIDKTWKLRGRKLDFMGFVFSRDHTVLRKSIMLSISRKAKSLSMKETWSVKDAQSMLSYRGWIKHADVHSFYMDKVKTYVDFYNLRKFVSRSDRRKRHDELENRVLCVAA